MVFKVAPMTVKKGNLKWREVVVRKMVGKNMTKVTFEIRIVGRRTIQIPVENGIPGVHHHLVKLAMFRDEARWHFKTRGDIGVGVFEPSISQLSCALPVLDEALFVSVQPFINNLMLKGMNPMVQPIEDFVDNDSINKGVRTKKGGSLNKRSHESQILVFRS